MDWKERIVYWQISVFIMIGLDMLWAFLLKFAWNVNMPYLFGLPTISWFNAWTILIGLTLLWRLYIVPVKYD